MLESTLLLPLLVYPASDNLHSNKALPQTRSTIYPHHVPTSSVTFRSIASDTFHLLVEHPILAVPVLVADLISFSALHLQHALHDPLFTWLLSDGHSVLTNAHQEFVFTPENASKVSLIVFPLLWTCYFLNVVLYAAALITISVMVRDIWSQQTPALRPALRIALTRRGQVLRVSALFFALLFIAQAPAAALIWVSGKLPWAAHHMGFDLGLTIGLLVTLPVIFVSMQPALKLLRATKAHEPVSIKCLAIVFGMLTILAQYVIALLMAHVVPASVFQQKTVLGFLTREGLMSLLAASPYIPLFVALSLLAATEEEISVSETHALGAM